MALDFRRATARTLAQPYLLGTGLLAFALAASGCSPCASVAEDEDGDRLSCELELEMGTDPTVADSDGDGYLDGDEVTEGKDPVDPASVIYAGGWPYYWDKDSIDGPPWFFDAGSNTKVRPAVGVTLPRLVAVDQFGEDVEVYDFAYRGKPIMIDLSTAWCSPCKAIARWLEEDDDSIISDYPWWNPDWSGIPELVANGDIYWLTILYEDSAGMDAYPGVASRWYDDYPLPYIPVLADTEDHMNPWLRNTGIPTGNLLDEEMTMLTFSDRGIEASFDLMAEML